MTPAQTDSAASAQPTTRRRRARTAHGRAAAAQPAHATAALCAAGAAAHADPADPAAPAASLAGSAVPFARTSTALGDLPMTRRLTIQVWLRPALRGAEQFATAVSTPGNPMFRDFLTPDAYAARFGPTPREAATVREWLRARGLRVDAVGAQRDDVQATGTVAQLDAAFRTTLTRYSPSPGLSGAGAPLYANNGPLSAPAAPAADIVGVTGLNDAGVTLSLAQRGSQARSAHRGSSRQRRVPCSQYWGQHRMSGLPAQFGTRTFPTITCGYTGAQFRSAYGANLTNTGSGQTIAFSEPGGLEPHMFKTLQDFARENHLPAPSPARYAEINQQPSSCGKRAGSRGEEEMDVESAYAMAPGASQVVVGGSRCAEGDGGYQAGFDTDLAIIDGNGQAPLASVATNSWETGYDNQAPDITAIETTLLVKAAAVGVGMYYSAGDSPCTTQPASNPYATGVGGTTLAISRSGRRLFETGPAIGTKAEKNGAWTSKVGYFGLGGGLSLTARQPVYQKGIVPASMSTPPARGKVPGQCRYGHGPLSRRRSVPMRSAPDLSASDGNMRVGLLTPTGRYTHVVSGDTSLSAPLVAGMVIAAQQGQAKPFGFLNPALYRLAGTSAFYDPRPITQRDPVLWRASVCPARIAYCGNHNLLWITNDQSRTQHGYNGQVTTKGYDNTTGLGVPNGQTFIRALRRIDGDDAAAGPRGGSAASGPLTAPSPGGRR